MSAFATFGWMMDRLDTAYQSIVDEIRRLEDQLRHLRARLRVLDDARALVAEQLTSSEEARVRGAAIESIDERSGRLQDEVHRTLRLMSRECRDEFTAARVASAMRSNGHPNSDSRAFYASVYATLMRLHEKRLISAIAHSSGRRFRDVDGTLPGDAPKSKP